MQIKSRPRFSTLSWKSIVNLKLLSVLILPLVFSAAVHAETCPASHEIMHDTVSEFYAARIGGEEWKSVDRYSKKIGPFTPNYVEIRQPNGNNGQGVVSCLYSTDPRHTPRFFMTLRMSARMPDETVNALPVAGFADTGTAINTAVVQQCRLHGGDTGNCTFNVVRSGGAKKTSTVSPFGAAAKSCDGIKESADAECGKNPGSTMCKTLKDAYESCMRNLP